RLEKVGEDRWTCPSTAARLTASQHRPLAQLERQRPAGERRRADERVAQQRQLTFVELRIGVEKEVGCEVAEDRIAEELEPLVAAERKVRVLVQVRAVDERLDEEERITRWRPKQS